VQKQSVLLSAPDSGVFVVCLFFILCIIQKTRWGILYLIDIKDNNNRYIKGHAKKQNHIKFDELFSVETIMAALCFLQSPLCHRMQTGINREPSKI